MNCKGQKFGHRYKKTKNCWIWNKITASHGYGTIGSKLAHRLMWEKIYGKIPKGLCVLHKCDNRKCVNPNHLFLGTKGDNIRDAVKKQRNLVGELNGQSKLKRLDVIKIRALNERGIRQNRLAKIFNVSPVTIFDVVHKKTWKIIEI